jgi:hypothetical protein
MPISNAVTNQFEAELHEGDHKLLWLSEDSRCGALQSDAGPTDTGIDFPDGWEELRSEDKLGFARGLLWSLLFEAALLIAAFIYWKLRHTR